MSNQGPVPSSTRRSASEHEQNGILPRLELPPPTLGLKESSLPGMCWGNGFIRSVLLGTRDPGSPLYALRAKPDLMEAIFAHLKHEAASLDILAAAAKGALGPLCFACRFGTSDTLEAQDTVSLFLD